MARGYVQRARAESAATTRRRMVEAARAVLMDGEVPRLELAEVAQRAGLARSTLYLSFGTRSALMTAILDDSLNRAGFERIRGYLALPDAIEAMKKPSPRQRPCTRQTTRCCEGCCCWRGWIRTPRGTTRPGKKDGRLECETWQTGYAISRGFAPGSQSAKPRPSCGYSRASKPSISCSQVGAWTPGRAGLASLAWRDLRCSSSPARRELQDRPVYHRQRGSVEAHLTVAFAAVSRWIERHHTSTTCAATC